MERSRFSLRQSTMTWFTPVIVLALAALYFAQYGTAQDIPLISGGVGFFTSTNGGNTNYQPYIKPVLAAPLGKHVLVESRATVTDTFFPKPQIGYSRAPLFKTVDYLQADVLAGSHLTIV